VRNFTIFAPTDDAIKSAYESGAFNFPQLFANNKDQLAGIIAYHAVPQTAYVAPSRSTRKLETMLNQGAALWEAGLASLKRAAAGAVKPRRAQGACLCGPLGRSSVWLLILPRCRYAPRPSGHGKAACENPSLSWRPDGYVYGGSGAGKVGTTYDRGCAAVVFQIDAVLQPCCKPMLQLLDTMRAPKGSITEQALWFLKDKVKVRLRGEGSGRRVAPGHALVSSAGCCHTRAHVPRLAPRASRLVPCALLPLMQGAGGARKTFVMPSEEAWQALAADAQAANKTLTKPIVDAILSYLYADADVASVVGTAAPVKTALAGVPAKQQAAICPKGTNGTLVFAFDEAPPAVQPSADAPGAVFAAPGAALGAAPGGVLGAAPGGALGAAPLGAAPAGTLGAAPADSFGAAPGAALGLPSAADPATAAAYPGALGTLGAVPASRPVVGGGFPSAAAPQAPSLAGLRHLLQKLPTGGAASASNAESLVLPTAFSGARRDGVSVIPGPIVVIDGAAVQLGLPEGIKVGSITYACDGAIYHTNSVPLPCNFLGRKAPAPVVVKPAVAAPVMTAINASLVNTTNIPGAVAVPKSAAAAAAPMAASVVAAVLLGALLL
jgi:hypothetical protein